MSEQKMPALPEYHADGYIEGQPYWTQHTVECIRAEAIEFGRQQERERLEPLRVAVEEIDAEILQDCNYIAVETLFAAARTLLEQTE